MGVESLALPVAGTGLWPQVIVEPPGEHGASIAAVHGCGVFLQRSRSKRVAGIVPKRAPSMDKAKYSSVEYVGMDVHKQRISIAVVNAAGGGYGEDHRVRRV